LLATALFLAPPAALADPLVGVVEAATELEEGVWLLDADLRLVPSETMRQAVDNGARLELRLTIEVYREHAWWPDSTLAQLTQRYSLRYHPLTRRVVTTAHNSGLRRSYADLEDALRALGRLQRLPILDHTLLAGCDHCYGRLRAELGVASVPLLLQPVHWFTDHWRIESPWYRWPIGI